MKTLLLCTALLALPLAGTATEPPAKAASAAAADTMADAEVRKIDVPTGKITLKHGEIKSLDMPPMTMVFLARDKRLLDGLKVGDKVRFKTVREDGQFIVTAIEAQR